MIWRSSLRRPSLKERVVLLLVYDLVMIRARTLKVAFGDIP